MQQMSAHAGGDAVHAAAGLVNSCAINPFCNGSHLLWPAWFSQALAIQGLQKDSSKLYVNPCVARFMQHHRLPATLKAPLQTA
jgi:hypothetical protein